MAKDEFYFSKSTWQARYDHSPVTKLVSFKTFSCYDLFAPSWNLVIKSWLICCECFDHFKRPLSLDLIEMYKCDGHEGFFFHRMDGTVSHLPSLSIQSPSITNCNPKSFDCTYLITLHQMVIHILVIDSPTSSENTTQHASPQVTIDVKVWASTMKAFRSLLLLYWL